MTDDPTEFANLLANMNNISTNDSEDFSKMAFNDPPNTLKRVFDVLLLFIVVAIMLGMGCTVELNALKQHLRRPVAIAIGMFSQFVVLPASAFGIAHALQLSDSLAISFLVISCCPGGPISNTAAYWTDGDVTLSLTMTTLSTFLAIGMMPLNLFIYSRSWTNEALVIPYKNIFFSLLMALCPSLAGMFLKWKWQKIAGIVEKIGSIAGALSIVVIVTLMSVMYPFIYRTTWKVYVAASLLPVCGMVFGYIVASICRMTHSRRRTIALETGVQNFPLCMALLTLSYGKDTFATVTLLPLVFCVTGLLTTFLYCLLYKVFNVQLRCMNIMGVAEIYQEAPNDVNDSSL